MVTLCPQTVDGVSLVKEFFADKNRDMSQREKEKDQKMFMEIKSAIYYKLLSMRRLKDYFNSFRVPVE